MKIFLIGMMGSGKSYWMNTLSAQLGLEKYDLDELIEKTEGKTILQIFEAHGEAYFRNLEHIMLKWLSDKTDCIIATGGGAPCYHNNMEWMNKTGITIWLDEPTEILVKRLVPEKAHRPLIASLNNDELKNYLGAKKEERKQFYQQAQFVLRNEEITKEKLLSIIKKNPDA